MKPRVQQCSSMRNQKTHHAIAGSQNSRTVNRKLVISARTARDYDPDLWDGTGMAPNTPHASGHRKIGVSELAYVEYSNSVRHRPFKVPKIRLDCVTKRHNGDRSVQSAGRRLLCRNTDQCRRYVQSLVEGMWEEAWYKKCQKSAETPIHKCWQESISSPRELECTARWKLKP